MGYDHPIKLGPPRSSLGEHRGGVPPELRGVGLTNLFKTSGPQMGKDPLADIAMQLSSFSATQVLKSTMIPRAVTIGLTPVQVISSKALKGYLIINQSSALASGTTATGTFVASALRSADGNSQADSVGVANFRSAHLYLDISVNSGNTMDVYVQSKDPASGLWADAGMTWPDADTASAVGTYYAYLGPNGLASDIAFRWDMLGVGDITFSIGYVLKEGLPGSQTGISRTIYIGGNNGITVESGFPLLEGQSWAFFMEENSELWAIAETATILNVLELQ